LELTLGDVAERLGVSPVTVSNWSSGDATPEPDDLVALAGLLEVPANDLATMAGVALKTPEPAVNLLPQVPEPRDAEAEPITEESTGPIAMLRSTDEEPPAQPEAAEEDEPRPAGTAGQAAAVDVPVVEGPSSDQANVAEQSAPDKMDSELAELIEEAASEERREPIPSVVTRLPGPEEAEPVPRRRTSVRRRRPAEQPVTGLPLTYIEDPQQLTRYRIRWALTVVILVIMFFILLWASRELLSALSEVKQAVTPGGIGG
jgi:transcriptional regulator with XRE-family HTH domain